MTSIKKNIVLRTRIVLLVMVFFAFSIIYKIFIIQVLENDKWEKLAKAKVFEYKIVKATRGNIYSDNGSLLATSIPFYRLAIDPTVSKDDLFRDNIDSLALLLAQTFKDKTKEEYYRRINSARIRGERYLILNRNKINYQLKKSMDNWPLVREGKYIGGVIFEKIEQRYNPFKILARRTVGFINEENKGVGLEYTYNAYLKGQNGEALFQRMAGGNWKPIHNKNEKAPIQGVDIQTTIDVNVQDVAEASLMKHLEKHDADNGCVILMEVATGEIKAMVNLGKLKDGSYTETYNFAVGDQGLTEPGSTFKLASFMALFEDKNELSLKDSVYCEEGSFDFYDRKMRDSKPWGYKWLSLQEVFEKSSNIGVSKLVNEHFSSNPQRYIEYIRKFGLSEPVGFQIKGEAKPYFKSPSSKNWYGTTLPWMSIGYELKLAPVQTLAFYNAVANNGKFIQPIIVKEIKVADRVLERFSSRVIADKICSDETLEKCRRMLEGVVEHGTARNINNAIYKIAGKTGTAQKLKNGVYTKTYYTSFAGYFPADKPKYSCIVVIDNPKGINLYGADVAAPVFKEIADKIYAVDLELHEPMVASFTTKQTTLPVIRAGKFEDVHKLCNEFGIANHTLNATYDEWVSSVPTNNAITWVNRKVGNGFIPNVIGLTLKDAFYLLENSGYVVNFEGEGRVIEQSITPGTKAKKGSVVFVKLSN